MSILNLLRTHISHIDILPCAASGVASAGLTFDEETTEGPAKITEKKNKR